MQPSRRELLIGAGAVLGVRSPRGLQLMPLADMALLASLTSLERELVREVMADYPALKLAETVEMLRAAGM